MKQNTRKVILYIAMSLDGYIASVDGDFSFLSVVDQEGEDYGYSEFHETVDTIILGRKTYDQVLSMGYELPYPDKDVFVLTQLSRQDFGKVKFYSGSISDLIAGLRNKEGKHIYCDGGAETVHRLLQEDLIDELIISVIPVLLGDGIPLFKKGFPEKRLKLIKATSYEKGLVRMHYERVGK